MPPKTIKPPTKEERINAEEKRLRKSYANIPALSMNIIDGLVRRAAWMRVTLEDYEMDLDKNGYFEMFSQSPNTEPYERERPVARLYNQLNKNYQSIVKQLQDALADDKSPPHEDELAKFLLQKPVVIR